MDDTPDKLRRNVVALSAAILAVFFLNLSFKPSASLLGIADVGNLAAWKVWLCLSVVLVYMFLRYRFDDATEVALKSMQAEYHDFVAMMLARLGQRVAERYLLRGHLPSWTQGLDALNDAEWQAYGTRYGRLRSVKVDIGVRTDSPDRFDTVFICREIDGKWDRDGVWKRSISSSFSFKAPGPLRVLVRCKAAWRTVYSKGAVDVAVPFALAALAASVCLIRLGGFAVKLV